MPEVMRHPHVNSHHHGKNRALFTKRNFAQSTTLILGVFLVVLSLCGLLMPSFAGLHLSAIHATSLGVCGVLSIWAGAQNDLRKNFVVDVSLCIFFLFHALAGFLLGAPGKPGVGFEAMDPLLVKIMPGFNELGRNDHIMHTLVAFGFFLALRFLWKHYRNRLNF